jgi:hypothetical protein
MRLTTLTIAAALALAPLTLAAQDHNAAAMPMKPRVPPSNAVLVTFDGHTTRLALDELRAMPQITVHVFNAHRNTNEDYTGPLLSDVLAKAGLIASSKTEPLILHSGLIATGTDKYFLLYSLAEVEPMFSNGKVIIALTKNGGQPNDEGGMIELVNTDGAKPARWLHGLDSLDVITLSSHP